MKAKFLGKNGHSHELKQALSMGLIPGNMYDIEDLEVGGFSSQLYLVGYKNKLLAQFPPQLGENLYSFNTVMFEFYDDTGKEIDIYEEFYNKSY